MGEIQVDKVGFFVIFTKTKINGCKEKQPLLNPGIIITNMQLYGLKFKQRGFRHIIHRLGSCHEEAES